MITKRTMASAAAVCMLAALGGGTAHTDLGDCTQPLTTGASPAASDCLFILKSAVGSASCDPQCVCDPDVTLTITATDSLICIKGAVGQTVSLDCNCYDCGFVLNGTFDYPVTAQVHNGWTYANISGGGHLSSGGNPDGMFRLNQAGEVDTDPTVFQLVTGLDPGKTYEITGEYRSYAPEYGNPNKMDAFVVAVEPQPVYELTIFVGKYPRPSPAATTWTPFLVSFEPSASTAKISFLAERDGDDSSFDIDNLCLKESPL